MAGTNETSYFLKHGNNLNPLVSKKSDLEDQNIPKWDDTEQRLTDSAVSESYDSVADETTVAIDGNAEIDGKANITGDTAIGGNVEVDGTSQFNDDVTIGKAAQGADPEVQADLHVVGNIYQSGASVQTHLEQIYTTKDHIFLRYGEVAALANGDHSGLKIIKPDGTYDVHLCVNNDNYAYVGEVDNNDDPIEYTGHYQFWDSGLYYDDDPDSPTYEQYFDDAAFTKPHNFYIPTGAENVTYTDITPVGDYLHKVEIEYTLTEESLQRLLTVDDAPEDQSLLYYDVQLHKARTIQKPATQDGPLVPVLDGDRVTYREYKAGGEGEGDANNWSGTLAEYETAEQVVDPDDPDYIKDKSGVDIYGLTAADLDIATEVREGDNQPVTSGAVYNAVEGAVVRSRLDWSNAIPVSVQQIFDGYTCPVDGMFYLWVSINTSTSSGKQQSLTVNGTRVAYMLGTITNLGDTRPSQLTFPVSEGDVIGHTGTGIAVSNYTDPAIYLIPYKE